MMRLAYDILTDIVQGGAYANLALKKGLAGCDSKQAGRVTALVYETLEHISYADYLIAAYAKGRVHGSIRNILRLSLTRLFFMDAPDHAVCRDGAELAKQIGKASLAGYVNAVLRSVCRARADGTLVPLPADTAERLTVQYGMPRFMVDEYLSEYGAEFAESLLSSRLHSETVRAQYPFTTDELTAELQKRSIPFRRGRYDRDALILSESVNVPELDLFKQGKMTVQSESAMLVCRACRVKDGMRVLDACAAPGGKTCFISGLMHGAGSITAWELHPHRAELIRKTAERLGVRNVSVRIADASDPAAREEGESFDVVLCDVPCSGLGGGSKPDALLNRTEKDVEALSRLQYAILMNTADLVRPGGALVYSTCTVSKRENRENVERFLRERPDFVPEPLSDLVPGREPAPCDDGPFLQLLPNRDGIDGFFIARMIKTN